MAKAAERCGVHYTTAFRWRHRFLGSLSLDKPKRLAGIVEAIDLRLLIAAGVLFEQETPRVRRQENAAAHGVGAIGELLERRAGVGDAMELGSVTCPARNYQFPPKRMP